MKLIILGSCLSALFVFVYFALLLQQPEWSLGGVLPVLRTDQLSNHWLTVAGYLGGSAFVLVAAALIRRRYRDDLTVPVEEPKRRLIRSHLWLLVMLVPPAWALIQPSATRDIVPFIGPWLTCLGLAGWLSGLWTLALPGNPPASPRVMWTYVIISALAFGLSFGALAILQYRALLVPHGDAGMYEEHLWNFLHGKGFRSQLDDGRLFLGEHIEIIHMLFVPIYWLRPELPTLNVCQAFGLASGAIAVFGLARRIALPIRSSASLACAYLAYFPLQYLALEETWKTFRPETLGVPLVLFALWFLESERYRWMSLFLLLSFLAKEEFALVAAGIGVSLATRGKRRLGLGIAVFSLAYLVIALQVLIPFFRDGAPPHYVPYFSSLGNSPADILRNIVLNPKLIWDRIASPESIRFAVMMLMPFLFLPLLSWRRFLVAIPIFGYLMMADLDRRELRLPWFHFHAPLVAVLPWCAAWGLKNLADRGWLPNRAARFVLLMSLLSCIAFGRGPMSYKCYDPLFGIPIRPPPENALLPYLFEPQGSYWRDLYLQTPRSTAFRQAQSYVRPIDRVAATDYVRARFTHCKAAHDYPTFRGHVTINDIDVFVLDRTEGWWGRDPKTNRDHELLNAMNSAAPQGTKLRIRGRPYAVVYHDDFFLVVRASN